MKIDPLACPCGHPLGFHHETRGCGWLGFSAETRCPCPHNPEAAARARLLARLDSPELREACDKAIYDAYWRDSSALAVQCVVMADAVLAVIKADLSGTCDV